LSVKGVVLELIFASLIICYFKIWCKSKGRQKAGSKCGSRWQKKAGNGLLFKKFFVALQRELKK